MTAWGLSRCVPFQYTSLSSNHPERKKPTTGRITEFQNQWHNGALQNAGEGACIGMLHILVRDSLLPYKAWWLHRFLSLCGFLTGRKVSSASTRRWQVQHGR